jgi:hypothetical protein
MGHTRRQLRTDAIIAALRVASEPRVPGPGSGGRGGTYSAAALHEATR